MRAASRISKIWMRGFASFGCYVMVFSGSYSILVTPACSSLVSETLYPSLYNMAFVFIILLVDKLFIG